MNCNLFFVDYNNLRRACLLHERIRFTSFANGDWCNGANGLRGVNSCTTHKTLYNESLQTQPPALQRPLFLGSHLDMIQIRNFILTTICQQRCRQI